MNKRALISAIILVLAVISAFSQGGKKFFKAGNALMESLKYDDAVVQYTNAIGLEPSNAEYYSARGLAYENLGKFNEAYTDFGKSVIFNSKDVEEVIKLGRVCNKMGKYNEALALLNKATGMDKRNARAYPEKVITLIGLEKYDQALRTSDTAILIRDDAMHYYYRGIIYANLNNDIIAKREFEKSISKDKKAVAPRLALADLLVRINDTKSAMEQVNTVLAMNDKNVDAYVVRSRIYKKQLDYANAINDLSKTILIDAENPEYYLIRGTYYQEFNQHSNAINDFSKYITLKSDNPDAYYSRAKSYEEIMNYEKAMEDYMKISVLSEYDPKARKMLKQTQSRLYELNRENIAPEISITSPSITDNTLQVKGDSKSITISGKVREKSLLDTLLINNNKIMFGEKVNGENEFLANIDISGTENITVYARDEYNNEKVLKLKIQRTEINPPKVTITAPYSADNQVYLDEIKPTMYVQGRIEDESMIRSIEIDGVIASYRRDQFNPVFNANLEISNVNKFTVTAEDIYGNRTASEFYLNRENALLSQNNPMGKTWVVFIENSSYESFASLDGPIKDISAIQRALSNYQIHRFWHQKDMTKTQLEKFFNIELRDELKANQVKSLLVWYAGHGKFINEVGYWIPVDAKRDDEFTYFSINTLKAGMQSYSGVVHTLVVTDACESGPTFYQAMRGAAMDEPTCDNVMAITSKSAQVFSSAGYELAVDNSQFTQTFANTLINNPNACIPIETIVKQVRAAVSNINKQTPKFGTIAGLQDENGTFFFIAK